MKQQQSHTRAGRVVRVFGLVACGAVAMAVVPSLTSPFTELFTAQLAAQPATPRAKATSKAQPTGGVQAQQPQQPQQPLEADANEAQWTRWTNGRYRITPGDVIEVRFPFVPELDQTVSVQPDGYATLREIGDLRISGRTVPELRADLDEAYKPIVRDLVFTVVLKEFEKPYFVAAGEITRPGRYDLRGATTLTQALAYAGGPTGKAKTSDVVIFRAHTEDTVSVRQVNIKEMYDKRDLSEDPLLQPGDTIYVPKSKLGKMAPILSRIGVGMYLNPADLLP